MGPIKKENAWFGTLRVGLKKGQMLKMSEGETFQSGIVVSKEKNPSVLFFVHLLEFVAF